MKLVKPGGALLVLRLDEVSTWRISAIEMDMEMSGEQATVRSITCMMQSIHSV